MDFLDRFAGRDRDRLLASATTLRLGRGDHLIRRGDRGGDIFRVAEGELEVIDNRQQPAVVIDVLGRGAVVGEMAFLDESLRSADVRAADGAVCQRWERGALIRLLNEDPALGASFYKVIAMLVTERSRAVRTMAMSGTLATSGGRQESAQAQQVATALAGPLRDRLMELEPLTRRERELARREVLAALRTFGEAVGAALGRLSDEDAVSAGEILARELHPYVIRSHLGELALDRPAGHAADPQALAHLHAADPAGDGPLGEILDEWLLGLPTSRAFRERAALTAEIVLERLPPSGAVRLLLLNTGGGALLGELLPHLNRLRGELVCVDGSREALAAVDRQLAHRVSDLRVRLVHVDLGALAMGRTGIRQPGQDIVVIDGLFDHLPERVAATLLGWAREQVAEGGTILANGVADAPDDAVFRYLLRWPIIRHRKGSLLGQVRAAGLIDETAWSAGPVGLVVGGKLRDGSLPPTEVRPIDGWNDE